MWLETTTIYGDGTPMSVTTERDFSYTRYPGQLRTDLVDGSLLQQYYFSKSGENGTRYSTLDYAGIERNEFPMFTDRGATTYDVATGQPLYQTYMFEYNMYMSLAPGL